MGFRVEGVTEVSLTSHVAAFMKGLSNQEFSNFGGGEGGGKGSGGGEVCDSCQCSHMSNTPMHDVHMLEVLMWTQ